MTTYTPIDITYLKTSDSIDFNLRNVPNDVLLSLSNALAREYQNQLSSRTDPHFRQERAKFIDNVTAGAAEKGLDIKPSQLLLGFR